MVEFGINDNGNGILDENSGSKVDRDDKDETNQFKAQDYNSSRFNKTRAENIDSKGDKNNKGDKHKILSPTNHTNLKVKMQNQKVIKTMQVELINI